MLSPITAKRRPRHRRAAARAPRAPPSTSGSASSFAIRLGLMRVTASRVSWSWLRSRAPARSRSRARRRRRRIARSHSALTAVSSAAPAQIAKTARIAAEAGLVATRGSSPATATPSAPPNWRAVISEAGAGGELRRRQRACGGAGEPDRRGAHADAGEQPERQPEREELRRRADRRARARAPPTPKISAPTATTGAGPRRSIARPGEHRRDGGAERARRDGETGLDDRVAPHRRDEQDAREHPREQRDAVERGRRRSRPRRRGCAAAPSRSPGAAWVRVRSSAIASSSAPAAAQASVRASIQPHCARLGDGDEHEHEAGREQQRAEQVGQLPRAALRSTAARARRRTAPRSRSGR